ncbi:MAG TPA: hypothetical protein DCM05_15175 [Elusimicrobia bacterium]|nr:hypothetical protein [Elusimicrobiota bacterium]
MEPVREVFRRLDYRALGKIYCHRGGNAFWKAKREPCLRLGLRLARALHRRLKPGGRSLYVGAGVAELPALLMETLELGRKVSAFNLRKEEVRILNAACRSLPLRFRAEDALQACGRFDHLWLVSVLNDPERFPELSAVSYGRSNALALRPLAFEEEFREARRLAGRCFAKLSLPALVTTSEEELPWVTQWCKEKRLSCRASGRWPTALVGDPVVFVRVGERPRSSSRARRRTARPPARSSGS